MSNERLTEKECYRCKTVKPAMEYPKKTTPRRGGLSTYCTMCWREIDRKRRAEKRDTLNAYKLARGCADCGYREHPSALEFDHLPGTKKLFNISPSITRSLEAQFAEIAKCEVVCANCHAVRTTSRGYWNAVAKEVQHV